MSKPEFKIVVPYKDRPKASIIVAKITEPYGENSETVISVGCTLKGDTDNPSWKVHVPVSILDDVVRSIKEVASDDFSESPEDLA